MAVNEKGYIRPTYDDLLESRIALARELFGEDIDISDATPLGKFIRLSVQDLAEAYEAQEIIYYSRFPKTATGQSLDRLMPFAGITRNPATRAEHEITFTGTVGYEIPVGFLVGTTGEEEFYLVNPVTIGEDGTAVGIVQCTEPGTVGNVILGDITEIINPDADVSAIEHTDFITIAEDTESDVQLRERFALAIEGSGSGTASAIRGAVLRVNGVTGCTVIENNENASDADGRPPHSFEVYVHASDTLDQEVAEAIFEKKPLGIKSVGDISVNVTDASGKEQSVCFSRVAETAIYVKLTIATDTHFELDGVNQIKTALIGYVNELATGEDVVYTSFYKYIYGIAGVRDVTALTISDNGSSFVAKNLSMEEYEIARLSADNITIEVTAYADA